MAGEATTYLDEQKLERTLRILEKEREACVVTRWQKFFLYSFTILIGMCIFFGIILIFLEFLYKYIHIIHISLNNFLDHFFHITLNNFKEGLGVGIFFSAVLAFLFFLFNLHLIYQIFKFHRLVNRLGLAAQLEQVFSRQRQLPTRKVKLYNIIKGFAVIPAIAGFILFWLSIIFLLTGDDKQLWIIVLTISLVLMAPVYLLRGKQRLSFFSKISNLENSLRDSMLRAQGAGVRGIEVPTKELKKIAVIERSQIEQERAKAIKEYKEYAGSAYVVSRSPEASKAISGLDPKIRIKAVEMIETLSSEPHPAEPARDPQEDCWCLEVPHTSFSLIYTVNDATRQIKIIGLASLPAGPDAIPGGRDA